MSRGPALDVRAATADDEPAVLELLAASLRWVPDELFAEFFAWKHRRNPFGESPAWIALDGDRVAGFRTFMRWEFEDGSGTTRRAVRAVDTATHPDYQGQGIFRMLTLHALDELSAEGVDFVFNTPNDKSRPGYLTMGWHEVGRLPTSARPTSLRGAVRMLRSRVPADRWSAPGAVAMEARDVLTDEAVATLRPAGTNDGLRTRRTAEYLRWRYGFPALGYRAVVVQGDARRGVAVFRRRRRGQAIEAALCDILVPDGDRSVATRLARAVVRVCKADYVVRLGSTAIDAAGFVRLPRQGPMLTCRCVTDDRERALAQWHLTLGDVELF